MVSTVMLPVSQHFLWSPDRRNHMGSVIQALDDLDTAFCLCCSEFLTFLFYRSFNYLCYVLRIVYIAIISIIIAIIKVEFFTAIMNFTNLHMCQKFLESCHICHKINAIILTIKIITNAIINAIILTISQQFSGFMCIFLLCVH